MPNLVIDARGMSPPDPLERAVAALDRLGRDDDLTLIVNRRPYPLFLLLANYGYKWNEVEETDGYRYRISKT